MQPSSCAALLLLLPAVTAFRLAELRPADTHARRALVRLSGGTILIDGVDLDALSLLQWRRRINVVPQEPILFKGTVGHNLDP